MSLLSLPEARQTLMIDEGDTSGDPELTAYVAAITTVVEEHVGEIIDRRTVTKRLRLRGQGRFFLGAAPVVSLTSLTGIDGTVFDITGMDVDPDTGVVEVFRGPTPTGTVVAVYEAGYAVADIPNNYKRGAAIILQHIWETQRGVGNVLGGVIGEEERLNREWMYSIPRKALEWLGKPAPGV